MPTKITETIRSAVLRHPLKPSVTRDSEIGALALHVTTQRGFWALAYSPHGLNPATGKRWGSIRHELGDAMTMTAAEARSAALAAKALVRQGRDPHREALASRAAQVAMRAVLPQSASEALDAYAKALMARRQPSEWTRSQSVRYARKGVRLMKAESLALAAVDPRMIRLLVETAPDSDTERQLVFRGLRRFLAWCRKTGLIESNPCDDLDRDERPKPGKARDHVPSVEQLRAVWAAVEDEPRRDLIRVLLLLPLRRNEASGLTWGEIDFAAGRIRVSAGRTKTGALHELPLSPPALALLKARRPAKPAAADLVFPSNGNRSYDGWDKLLRRIRKRIGEAETARAQRFSLHDVRRSFVSALAERGFDVDLLDQCLGHTRKGVFGVYQRASRMAERERALSAWADLVTGAEASNVVTFRARS